MGTHHTSRKGSRANGSFLASRLWKKSEVKILETGRKKEERVDLGEGGTENKAVAKKRVEPKKNAWNG